MIGSLVPPASGPPRAARSEGRLEGRPASLVRRFVVVGLISVGPAALLSGWLMSSFLTRSLLDRERAVTVAYVKQAVAEAVPPEFLREPARAPARARIEEIGRALLRLPEAVRVKIFDARGTVVWSDEPRLIGSNFKDDQHVKAGLTGGAVVALERIGPTAEHVYEAGQHTELTAIYVPVPDPDTGRVLMLFEVYKLPDLFRTWIRRGQLMVWSIAFGMGSLLLLVQLSLVRRAAGTIARQHGDIEDRARQLEAMNAELRRAQRQLLEAERLAAFGEATVAVAHGLRNPLAGVRAVAQEALEGVGPGDPLREPLEDIMAQVDCLEARLRAFLDTTRPFELTFGTARIGPLAQDVIASVHRRLAEAGAAAHVHVADETPDVRCDRLKVEHAIQEVLINSIEAGAGTICVRCRPVDGATAVEMTIEDDGRGLAPSARERAFAPFFTTKALGTGVGLAAVRRIVEAHGGRASIAARPGGGTVVTLRLPVTRPADGPAG